MSAAQIPAFHPHPLIRGGHLQTLAGLYLPTAPETYRATRRHVTLSDGDQLVLHDDCPPAWKEGDRTALLIHGLAGCHSSKYMQRVASKLAQRGVRCFRMDLRGCGAGFGLARWPYHSGRSEDAAAALEFIAELCPGSPTALIGFSMGGNITLKLLGELGAQRCGGLERAVAICAPVDLKLAIRRMDLPANRMYDFHFVRLLWRRVLERKRHLPDALHPDLSRRPRKLSEFDEMFTAPICGFGTAENYYRQASSAPLLSRVEFPTLILSARDDPLVPSEVYEGRRLPDCVRLHLTDHGGHMGFIGRPGADEDLRWMDWRVVEWVDNQCNGW